jgi:hypothetical protein
MIRKTLGVLLLAFSASLLVAPAVGQDKVRVTKRDCKRVLKRQVKSAEYKPGVDARGRRVKSADLGGGSPIKLPKEITIDIGIDLDEKYGLGSGGKYTGTANIGKVKVRDSQVFWNGQPLGNHEQSAIADACRRMYGKK